MHLVLSLTLLSVALSFWLLRWQLATGTITMQVPSRQWLKPLSGAGFGSQPNPIDQVEDTAVLSGLLALTVLAEGPEMTPRARTSLLHALQWHLSMTAPEATDVLDLGARILRENTSPAAARRRLVRHLIRRAGSKALAVPICVIEEVAGTMGGFNGPQGRAMRQLRHQLGA